MTLQNLSAHFNNNIPPHLCKPTTQIPTLPNKRTTTARSPKKRNANNNNDITSAAGGDDGDNGNTRKPRKPRQKKNTGKKLQLQLSRWHQVSQKATILGLKRKMPHSIGQKGVFCEIYLVLIFYNRKCPK